MVRFVVILLILVCAPPATAAATRSILVLGDSLSAAYGMDLDAGWVALLRARLDGNGHDYRVVNASQSGATSHGALALLPRALDDYAPTIVIIEIGGNDGLRGLPLVRLRNNIRQMIEISQRAGARVLLTGIRIPPNYGPAYTEKFHAIYGELAEQYDAALVPHLLDDVALNGELMQADGIHPNERAQPVILDAIWPHLQPLL